jgi:hypothetical protein
VQVLDPSGASVPSLRAIPGAAGYLLAYEKQGRSRMGHVRIRYYATLAALRSNRAAAQVDLPIRFSPFNNGTPSFLSIDWRGGPARSVVKLAFHYETARRRRHPGPDREAVGTLGGLRRWQAAPDAAIDALLARRGLAGNHGGVREFAIDGRRWRVYEGQTAFGDFSGWHVLLYDVSSGALEPLALRTPSGRSSSSFGNPTATVLRAPDGSRRVLVVTVFVFSAGPSSSDPGELVYYQPL